MNNKRNEYDIQIGILLYKSPPKLASARKKFFLEERANRQGKNRPNLHGQREDAKALASSGHITHPVGTCKEMRTSDKDGTLCVILK